MFYARFEDVLDVRKPTVTAHVLLDGHDNWSQVEEDAADTLGVDVAYLRMVYLEEGDYPSHALLGAQPELDSLLQWANLELHERDIVHGFLDVVRIPGVKYHSLHQMMEDANRNYIGTIGPAGEGLVDFFEDWFHQEHASYPHPSILDAINLNHWLDDIGFEVDYNSTGNVYG